MTANAGWRKWTGTNSEWDALLLGFKDSNIYQTWNWGIHRSEFGWGALPMIFTSGSEVKALALVLVKKKLGSIVVCWIPGGPVGDISQSCHSLSTTLSKLTKARAIYVHMSPMAPFSDEVSQKLQVDGWSRPAHPLNTGKTLIYSAFGPSTVDRSQLSKNWNRNLSRGEQRNLRAVEWHDATASQISEVTNEMLQFKQLPVVQDSIEINESLLKLFKTKILLTKCTNSDEKIIALRGVIKFGEKAFDMFAASTPVGRKEYASNLCLWKIIELCARDGITYYDLSGADATNNQGVYSFKKGVGAKDFEYQGEWVISRPRIIGGFISRMIARRLRNE